MKRATVEKLAKRIGADIDWDNSWITREDKHICIEAPAGTVFNANACSVLVLDWYSGPAPEFWQMVFDDLSSGVSSRDSFR